MQSSGDETGGSERIGHDQLFKQLLQGFFPDFLRLFDPQTAASLDLGTVSFRDTEAFTDIPQGERRLADLVAQVATTDGTDELILIHVEIQREREAHFPYRMWQYYSLLCQRENLPVLPIALVLYPGREGIAQEAYEEAVLGRSILTFRYLQISLPRLEATDFVQAESVLGAGLASTMHVPAERTAQIALHLAGLRRVHQARVAGEIDDARAFLLVNLIATYLPLSVREREALRVQLQQEGDPTMEATELTWADQVYEEGKVQGLREAIERLVRTRFGRVTPELAARLAAITREEELAAFIDRVGTVQSEDEMLAP
jgi:Putative transposase, YhgA-like